MPWAELASIIDDVDGGLLPGDDGEDIDGPTFFRSCINASSSVRASSSFVHRRRLFLLLPPLPPTVLDLRPTTEDDMDDGIEDDDEGENAHAMGRHGVWEATTIADARRCCGLIV
jgi:hypothetical protein